jgi:hypothetical protein
MPQPGQTISVVIDSEVRGTPERPFVFVKHDEYEGLLNVKADFSHLPGEAILVDVTPKGSLLKDFKCRVHKPEDHKSELSPPAPQPDWENTSGLKGRLHVNLMRHPEVEAYLRSHYGRGDLGEKAGDLLAGAVALKQA